MRTTIFVFVSLFLICGCSVQRHRQAVQDNASDRITVGKVQREITLGMPSADVVQILGSPNVVTTDDERREVWVYDKISTDVTYSNSEQYGTLLIIGATANSGANSTSQRTLTIIIKFDKDNKVRDFAYHTSRF